ncbi:MAG: hypothetical protein KDC54_13120 [Lewinella sp.]|nr:hypothetical protein [Lewinella sp.]
MKNYRYFLYATVGLVFLSLVAISATSVHRTGPAEMGGNTLKSVSLFQDTVALDAKVLRDGLAKMNAAIADIGYPEAGYQLWEVEAAEGLGFHYMVEGHWPDEETYQLIHDDYRYTTASEEALSMMTQLARVSYHRYSLVE